MENPKKFFQVNDRMIELVMLMDKSNIPPNEITRMALFALLRIEDQKDIESVKLEINYAIAVVESYDKVPGRFWTSESSEQKSDSTS